MGFEASSSMRDRSRESKRFGHLTLRALAERAVSENEAAEELSMSVREFDRPIKEQLAFKRKTMAGD